MTALAPGFIAVTVEAQIRRTTMLRAARIVEVAPYGSGTRLEYDAGEACTLYVVEPPEEIARRMAAAEAGR